MSEELIQWLDVVDSGGGRLYLKRLSGNDTKLTRSHQAGLYVPNSVAFDVFPSVEQPTSLNPRVPFTATVRSHALPEQAVNLIWYNDKVSKNKQNGRNECRITRWGGVSSPMLDPESTGSLVALWFPGDVDREPDHCDVWLCSTVSEEDLIEVRYGPVEPGKWLYLREPMAALLFTAARPEDRDCRLTPADLPPAWLTTFPSGEEIIEKAISLKPSFASKGADDRVLLRRNCEYEVFLSVEQATIMPTISAGFPSVDTFMNYANSVANRRKSRSGRSLELHAKRIFGEEELTTFTHGAISENNRRPDFLFPSADAYHDLSFPTHKLRMLAAKTTCKERWNQVANEAERIEKKHLLTLQEGVSVKQYNKMIESGIVLVVPKPLHTKYPKELRGKLITFSQFIAHIKAL